MNGVRIGNLWLSIIVQYPCQLSLGTTSSKYLGKTEGHPQGTFGLSKGFSIANQGLLSSQLQTWQGATCCWLCFPTKPHCGQTFHHRKAAECGLAAGLPGLAPCLLWYYLCDLGQCVSQFSHLQNVHSFVKCLDPCLAPTRYHIGLCLYYTDWLALHVLSHQVRGLIPTSTFLPLALVSSTLLLLSLCTEGWKVPDTENV